MKFSKRLTALILFIAIILFAGMLFWPFILNEIITPTSLVVWLLLRMFVLSIDQKLYWGAIIFIVAIFLFRLLPQAQTTFQSEIFPDSNTTIKTIEYWRSLFTPIDRNARDEVNLKRELAYLVASLYASKQRTSPNFTFYDALQRGDISLPEHIRTFLFPDKPKQSGRFPKKLMQFIRETPRKWMRRWTGQETAEYCRMIDEILNFMETSLEIENDEGKFTPNKN
jgi:hypothetical protein